VRNSNDNDRGFTQIEDKVIEENPSSVEVKTQHEDNKVEYNERSEQVHGEAAGVLQRVEIAPNEMTGSHTDNELNQNDTGKDSDSAQHIEGYSDQERTSEAEDSNTGLSIADEAPSEGHNEMIQAKILEEDMVHDSNANKVAGIAERDAADDDEHLDGDVAENDAEDEKENIECDKGVAVTIPESGEKCSDSDAEHDAIEKDELSPVAETGNNISVATEEGEEWRSDAEAVISDTKVEGEDDAMSRHQSYVTVKDAGRSDSDKDEQKDAAELNTSTDHNREHDELTAVRRDKEADSEAGADELTAAGEASSDTTTASGSEDQQTTEPETKPLPTKESCTFENGSSSTDNRGSGKEIQPNSTEVQTVRNSNDNDRGFTQDDVKVAKENPSSVEVKTQHEDDSAEYGERSEQVTVTSTTTSGSVVEPLVSPQTTCVNDVGDVVTDKKHDGKPAETTVEERNETVTEASKISTAVAAPDNMRDASEASESEVRTQKLMSSRADEQDVPPSSHSDSK